MGVKVEFGRLSIIFDFLLTILWHWFGEVHLSKVLDDCVEALIILVEVVHLPLDFLHVGVGSWEKRVWGTLSIVVVSDSRELDPLGVLDLSRVLDVDVV